MENSQKRCRPQWDEDVKQLLRIIWQNFPIALERGNVYIKIYSNITPTILQMTQEALRVRLERFGITMRLYWMMDNHILKMTCTFF